MIFYGMTDTGKVRKNNQDSFRILELDGISLAIVCDGMGGAAGGAQASSLAADTFCAAFSGDSRMFFDENGDLREAAVRGSMLTAVFEANAAVYKKALRDPSLAGMGTTLAACAVARGRVMAVNVGDSRIYAIYPKKAVRISRDHSYVQALVDNGSITEQQARVHPNKNIILRAVGTEDTVEADYFALDADMGHLLLCSDGLTNYIPDGELAAFFEKGTAEEQAKALTARANRMGGSDNITAIIADLSGRKAGNE